MLDNTETKSPTSFSCIAIKADSLGASGSDGTPKACRPGCMLPWEQYGNRQKHLDRVPDLSKSENRPEWCVQINDGANIYGAVDPDQINVGARRILYENRAAIALCSGLILKGKYNAE
ncbi:hypothetical protein KCG44_01870 [Pacificimonas sp. WHA3]|uniref:Uncharacterized protein n=1 Tax=Pacificimonas pallii TaxID=2827236 RepID=A0ABS6SCF2_9SPHN|nr:hypothetical protein [Pacificimonas pallii]MBV7255527.1 hypothetical protein [Pacificimonas pallii]